MIIDEFIEWQATQSEVEGFKIFADKYITMRSPRELTKDIMYQIYIAQCCIEGLIEDMEFVEKKEITHKKGNKKCT